MIPSVAAGAAETEFPIPHSHNLCLISLLVVGNFYRIADHSISCDGFEFQIMIGGVSWVNGSSDGGGFMIFIQMIST